MKKSLKVIAVIIVVLVALIGLFRMRFNKMTKNIRAEYAKISSVDLNKIPDGVYPGKHKEFLVSVDLEVTIKAHRITAINVLKQDCGKGYEASDTIPRIIKAQTPKVDAVTGATGSSMCIMIAVNKALLKK